MLKLDLMSIVKWYKYWILLMITLCGAEAATGQISSYEDQVQYELSRRGISERVFRELLLDANIDPDNLESLSAREVDEIERILEDYERLRLLGQRDILDDVSEGGDTIDISPLDTTIVEVDSSDIFLDSIVDERVYGQSVFAHKNIGFVDATGYRPPEDYVIGPGDEISVSIYGRSRIEESLRVQSDGSVYIRKGKVKLTIAGLDLQESRMKLERAYRNEYSFAPNQFGVYISAVHTIRVNVYGEVSRPGTYNISAANGITNVLAGVGGLTDDASVRRITIQKANGTVETFDLYTLLAGKVTSTDVTLQNGDNILVPTTGHQVSIEGAVQRPHTYELLEGEGLFDLIEYAGGLSKGAYLRAMKVNRYEDDKRIVKDVAYAQLVKQNRDYPLYHGDEVYVTQIDDELENYVTVRGEVRNEGNFELVPNMTLTDLISFAGVKSSTKMDKAFIRRLGTHGYTLLPVSLEDALNGVGESALVVLQDKDELIVYPKERFLEERTLKIDGAVRVPETFDYEEAGGLRAMDLISMAGGLRSDAADFAHLHRLDPLNPNRREYIHLNLGRIKANPSSSENIFLLPFDSIYVYSADQFDEEITVKVSGAVNSPGTFLYGKDMSLKDVIILANGLKQSSATNRIEVSRVVFRDNEATRTIIDEVSLDRQTIHLPQKDDYMLQPYDNIFVRHVPEFELQRNVVIKGEVVLPGEYSLVKNNETIYDLIQRAGGLTPEAFAGAARLYRSQDSIGHMVIRLEEVMQNPNSRFNQTLAAGDTLMIPKLFNQVTIKGATNYLQQRNIEKITVPYTEKKNAQYYIENYAGGFADNALTDKIFVKYPNGEVKTVKKTFPFGKKYPVVLPGSEINVWTKRFDPRSQSEKENVDWTKVLGDSVAQAASILTLILLVQRLD